MASIPLPALSLRPPEQQASPLEQFGKVLQLKSLLAQQQSIPVQQQIQQEQLKQEQLSTQAAQQQFDDQKAYAAAFKEWNPSKPDDLPGLLAKHGASGKAVGAAYAQSLQFKKDAAEAHKNQAQGDSAAFDALTKQADLMAGHVEALKQLPDEQLPGAILPTIQTAIEQGLVPKEQAQQALQQAQQIAQLPAAKIRPALDALEKQALGRKAILDQTAKQQEIATSQTTQQHVAGEEARAQQMQPLNVQEKKANITEKYAQANKAGLEAKLAQGGLDKGAIDQAAERYYSTGQLPSNISRGDKGAAVKQIMNRAAELHPDGNLAANSAEYKANAESLKKVQSNFDQVSAFEGTALKNLDLYVEKAKAIPDLGVRFANVPVRMLTGSMIGDKNYAALQAARQTAATETAKVLGSATGSGVLSDSQKKDASDVLDGNLPLKATIEVVNTIKQDFANRHQSYQDQVTDIKRRMGLKSQGTQQPAAQPAASSAPAANEKPVYVGGKLVGYTSDGKTMRPAQ